MVLLPKLSVSHQETREIQRGLPLTLPSRCCLDQGGERLAPGRISLSSHLVWPCQGIRRRDLKLDDSGGCLQSKKLP